jgi:hypothetical protein
MDTSLNDAAYRLISHSQVTIDANFRAPRTDEARRSALRVRFRDARSEEVAEAMEHARLLEDTAIRMADAFRGPGDGTRKLRLGSQRQVHGDAEVTSHFAFSLTSSAWPPLTSIVTGPTSSLSEPGFGRPVRM